MNHTEQYWEECRKKRERTTLVSSPVTLRRFQRFLRVESACRTHFLYRPSIQGRENITSTLYFSCISLRLRLVERYWWGVRWRDYKYLHWRLRWINHIYIQSNQDYRDYMDWDSQQKILKICYNKITIRLGTFPEVAELETWNELDKHENYTKVPQNWKNYKKSINITAITIRFRRLL